MKKLIFLILILGFCAPAIADEDYWEEREEPDRDTPEYIATPPKAKCRPSGLNRFVIAVQLPAPEIIAAWKRILPPGAKLTLCLGSNNRQMIVVGTFSDRNNANRHASRVRREIFVPYFNRQISSVSPMQGTP